jgi:hypothetical protein
MKKCWATAALIGLLTALPLHAAQNPSLTAFIDVNIVPMDRERVLAHHTVIVRDGRIDSIGPADQVTVPRDAQRVEGGGNSWLLPGLADMHTHLGSLEDAGLYLAGGVTTVLQMGGEGKVDPILNLRAALSQGAMAPQIFFAFMIDGPMPAAGGWPIHSSEEARFAVRVAKERHYDFVKVYNGVKSEEFDAIVDEARKAGLAVLGHGVRSVGLPAGLFRGQVMVAHAEEFYYTVFGYKPDASKLAAVVADTQRSGAYVTANLSAIDAIVRQWGKPEVRERLLRDPLVPYMSPYSRLTWASSARNYSARNGDAMDTQLAFLKQFVGALAKEGVPLLAGTDSPLFPGLVPGAGINEELRTLVESGLSTYQALAAATRTPGEFIAKYVSGAERIGVVSPGARADLMLVAENPLTSLETLRKPRGVMSAGRWRTAGEIQARLEENRRNLASVVQGAFTGAAP